MFDLDVIVFLLTLLSGVIFAEVLPALRRMGH